MGGIPHSLQRLLSVVFQSPCPLCQRSTPQLLCPNCQQQIQRCQRTIAIPLQEALPVVGWGEYGGGLKRAIAALKYENHPELAQLLGQYLADSWLQAPLSQKSVTVVPIPLHPDKRAQRGFNQAELIARSFCQATGLPLKPKGLARVQATEAQFSLSPQAREQNLAAAFALGQDFLRQRPGTVLLIDDIYTTGATVRSAAKVLRQQQISVCGVAAVAIAGQGFRKNNQERK
jgi:ComF family protein